MSYELISNLIGCAFGRWDISGLLSPESLPELDDDVFGPLPYMPVVSLNSIPSEYPIEVPLDGLLVDDPKDLNSLVKRVSLVISVIWGSAADNILEELSDIGRFKSLEEYITRPSGFFNFHFNRYTKSRREAPIYWPLSTKSGGYTVWVYYPRLNDQTLYKIVNNFIKPKQAEIESAIKKLELNSNLDNKGKSEVAELRSLFHEVKEMEAEILRVAALPYKPNHDDGALITAAPLHKLFRHAKWRKSTEDCWKALEKGEYDWAHLTYAIWPDRITKKCKIDLSMAIAHGLENICEIKPKQKKERVKKVPKRIKKDLKLDF